MKVKSKKKFVNGHEEMRREAQRVARKAVEAAKVFKKERDEVWALLNEERERRSDAEGSLGKLKREFDAYRDRCLDTSEVWVSLVQMLHKMGLDTGVITASRFWVNGVLLIRPGQVDPDNSDLRRSLRKMIASDERDKPINTGKILRQLQNVISALTPQRAIFLGSEFARLDPKDGLGRETELKLYARAASTEE